MTVPGNLYILPEALNEDVFEGALGKLRLRLSPPAEPQSFRLMDCFDQSICRSGKMLLEIGPEFHLYLPDGEVLTQTSERKGNSWADLAEGPVRDALRGFPSLRALLPICEGQVETRQAAVVDDLQKTRVRARFQSLYTDSGTATLVRLQGLRGYDKALDQLSAIIVGKASGYSGPAAALSALLPDQPVYVAKPNIALGKTEPAFEAAGDIIQTYLQVARQNESGTIADYDTEFLHDYRVSLRKIRSVLSLFKGVYSEAQTAALKTEFSDLMAATGRLRDLDVYLLEKQVYFDLLPEGLHAGLHTMFDQFEIERKAQHRALCKQFHSRKYERKISALQDLFAAGDGPEPGPNADLGAYAFACRLIWKRYKKVCAIARAIDAQTPDDDVHELRIHCKKLRYLMEFFGPLFDARTFKALLKPLKKLQDNLGLFNDYSVQQIALQEYLDTHQGRDRQQDLQVAQAIGGLITVLHQRQLAERARVVTSFAHFDSEDVQQSFRKLFHHKEA